MNRYRKKKSKWPTVLICMFTFLTTLLSLIIRIHDRKEILRAVESDEGVKTLLITKKETTPL